MKKKIVAIIITLTLIIGSAVPIFAESACNDSLCPEECQICIEFQGISPTRGPGGGAGGPGWPPPPIIT